MEGFLMAEISDLRLGGLGLVNAEGNLEESQIKVS